MRKQMMKQMMKGDQLSVRNMIILVFFFTIGSGSLSMPGAVVSLAEQDGLFCIVIGMLLSIALAFLYAQLVRRYPQMTLMTMIDRTFGAWIAPIIQIMFIFIVMYVGAGGMLYDMSTFTKVQILPDTPSIATIVLYASIVILALRLGIRTIATAAEMIFPFVLILFVTLILGVAPAYDVQKLVPLFASKPLDVYQGTILYSSYSVFVLVCFLMIFPKIANPEKHAFRILCSGMLFGGFVVLSITCACILVLGVNLTSLLVAPAYSLGKEIVIGKFLTRIEVVMAAFFYLSLFMKMVIYFYVGMKGIAHVLRLHQYKVLVAPVLLVIVITSDTLFENQLEAYTWYERVWTSITIFIGVIIPILILLFGKRPKKEGIT